MLTLIDKHLALGDIAGCHEGMQDDPCPATIHEVMVLIAKHGAPVAHGHRCRIGIGPADRPTGNPFVWTRGRPVRIEMTFLQQIPAASLVHPINVGLGWDLVAVEQGNNLVIDDGLLEVITPTDDELSTFIDLTLRLGDGEAMSVAIALHRGYTVVTDDRVAMQVIAGRVPVRSSLEMIKHWIDHEGFAATAIRAALLGLRQRGTYSPSRTHALRSRWDHHMALG